MAYDHDWFLDRIKERRPNDYKDFEFIEKYKSSKEEIKAIHKLCGNIVPILPNSFISRGSGCRVCNIKKRSEDQLKSHTDYERELPEGVITLERYTGALKKIKVHCFFCDSTYSTTARELTKNGCTRCSGCYVRTIEDIKFEVSSETRGEFEVLSDTYKNTDEKIKIIHNKCGEIYKVSMTNFRKGRRCPNCSSSFGEKLVKSVLTELCIEFERHKKFEGLRYINPLSYDFYLPEYNTLIEYNGEQHYMPVELFGGE